MDYEKHFNEILLNQEKNMLSNMIEDCKSDNEKNNIEDILTYITHKNLQIKSKNKVNSDIHERLSKIDEYLFKRPWNRLELIHKEKKMEEYFEKYLFECSEDNMNEIKEKIMNDLKNKKLNSAKKVNYDPVSTIILGIENLKYDNNTCTYKYK